MPANEDRPGPDREVRQQPPVAKPTPSTDVQPADAGTPASGNPSVPTEPAMKQTSKTDAERRS